MFRITMRIESTILLRKILLQPGLCPASRTNHRIWLHCRASAVCIIDTIGSRLHKKAGDQNYDFSSFIGSVFEPAKLEAFLPSKGPDILAILFSYSFCRSWLLELQVDRLLATNRGSPQQIVPEIVPATNQA